MDKIRELFEEKELRSARLRVKWNGARYEPRDSSNQWHVDFACKVNLSLDMFKAGYEAAKASQWISVEDNSMEFSKDYYVELENGRFCIGSWQQCDGYVRFTNGRENRALEYWPASMQPIRYTELPEGPTE